VKIYVASSWRNEGQPAVVARLRSERHEVYDFRAPDPGGSTPGGFQWSEIDPEWKNWTPEEYRVAVDDPIALHGLGRDFAAMATSDACVMVQPCGVSAALELGWMLGAGKVGIVLLRAGPRFEPELMFRLAHHLCLTLDEVVEKLRLHEKRR
jgi:hypothetical protein